MDILVKPSNIAGNVSIPSSKSLTHRYLICAALATGVSIIRNPLICADTTQTIKALQNLDVKIIQKNDLLFIEGQNGRFNPLEKHIYLGDSGTSSRLFIGLCTLSSKPIIITGSKRLGERPYADLLEALQKQSISIECLKNINQLPLRVTPGKLKGGRLFISGNISSQFISSLLLVSPFSQNDMEIVVKDELKSAAYVNLTIKTMQDFGIDVKISNCKSFLIKCGQKYHSGTFNIEGDYSSASYFMALSFLKNQPVLIKNLKRNSLQADKNIIVFLKKLGACVTNNSQGLTITRKGKIKTATIDVSQCPDIALTLAMIGPFTEKCLILKGTERLTTKESDRKKALIDNLKNLGAKIKVECNKVTIYPSELHSGTIETYNDHRVAMSFAILGTMIEDGLTIKNAEVVNKSYPHFFTDLNKIGVQIKSL